MSNVRLATESLSKRLRSGDREIEVLRDVNFEVHDGEFVAVLGPSGSGKSTLLGLLAGLDRPSAGSVRLDGRALESLDEDELALLRRHHVGFVFQSFLLLDNLTARENVMLPMDLAGTPKAAARADELLAEVGLSERGHHYPSQLSGGEQQRVALARAFGPRPALLLADEPTGNLDGATGRRVLELIAALQAREGTTLVMVTHDPEVAARATRRVHMADGRIVREERGASAADTAPDAATGIGTSADAARGTAPTPDHETPA